MPPFAVLLLAIFLVMPASAQPELPKIETHAEALKALENPDARYRLAGVIYIGETALAPDAPLLLKRLYDDNPIVRELAEQNVWLVWSRSGDPEADKLLASGIDEMNAEHYQEAIEIFTRVIRRKPDFVEGWNKRATAWFFAGNMRKSLADCDEVIKRNPLHFGALAGYGQIYLRLKEYEKALKYFRRALTVDPNLTSVEDTIQKLEEFLCEKERRTI